MDMTTYPIYLVGGSKGGVGKSFVALALADYLLRQDIHAALVETDTSNPDVMKAVQGEMRCIAYNLDDADGWIGLVNFCDEQRDAAIVVNTAARSQNGGRFGVATLCIGVGQGLAMVVEALSDLRYSLITERRRHPPQVGPARPGPASPPGG